MNYFFGDEPALAARLDAHQLEVRHVLNTGLLRRCNSDGVPSYRACDIAEARIAIHEAREQGQPFGSDIREPAKATKTANDEPEEVDSLDALDHKEGESEGEIEATPPF